VFVPSQVSASLQFRLLADESVPGGRSNEQEARLTPPDPPRPPMLSLRGRTVRCDAAGLDPASLVTLNVLAALALHARRRGYVLDVRNAPPEMLAFLRFAGLAEAILRTDGPSVVDPER
jgi:uncharacterized protein (TIGR03382 family)